MIIQLLASISFTEVAADADVSIGAVHSVLRSIARSGLAQPVAKYLLDEERRLSNERVRKTEDRERWRR